MGRRESGGRAGSKGQGMCRHRLRPLLQRVCAVLGVLRQLHRVGLRWPTVLLKRGLLLLLIFL